MKKISFIIPCYHSQNTIENVVSEINLAMNKLTQYSFEIILVNDNAPDETFDKIKEIAVSYKNIIGLTLTKNFGQHSALMAGFHQAHGDICICLDDDGQTPASETYKFIEKIEEGYDVVYASYKKKKHSLFRNLGSKINNKMAEIMIDKPKNIKVSSFFAVSQIIVVEIKRYDKSYPYVIGLVLRSTRNICNIEVEHRERMSGKSGYSIKKLISLWMNGFTAFSLKPLRIATYIGSFVGISGFIYFIYLLIRAIFYNTAPTGWMSLMSINLIMFGTILVVLGLIGEYIGRIYIGSNSSPQFIVRNIVKSENLEENVDNGKIDE